MDWLGLVGVLLALAFLIVAIYKGLNLIIAAPLATMIVIVFSRMPFIDSMFGPEASYMSGLAGFLLNNFPVFLFGAILAKYMDKSGAAMTIAEWIMRLVGANSPYRGLIALFVIASVLTYGGINVFVVIFILIPMARPIFKKFNMSWPLVIIPIFGGSATYTMTMMPASPALHNVVPSNALGTTLTADAPAGIVASIATIIFFLIYMKVALNRSQKRGEIYVEMGDTSDAVEADQKRPGIVASLAPIVVLIGLIVIFSDVTQIILWALFAAIILAVILYHRYVDHKDTLNSGALDSVSSVLTTGSTIAFGSFTVGVPAFQAIIDAIQLIPGGPMVTLSVTTMLLASITASSVGAEGIAVSPFGTDAIAAGVNPEVAHRLIAVSAGPSMLPHNGFLAVFNRLAGLNLRNTYGRAFISMHVPHYIAIAIVILMA